MREQHGVSHWTAARVHQHMEDTVSGACTDLVLGHGGCLPELELQLDVGRVGLHDGAKWGS